jgi:hypothetical protein
MLSVTALQMQTYMARTRVVWLYLIANANDCQQLLQCVWRGNEKAQALTARQSIYP